MDTLAAICKQDISELKVMLSYLMDCEQQCLCYAHQRKATMHQGLACIVDERYS